MSYEIYNIYSIDAAVNAIDEDFDLDDDDRDEFRENGELLIYDEDGYIVAHVWYDSDNHLVSVDC